MNTGLGWLSGGWKQFIFSNFSNFGHLVEFETHIDTLEYLLGVSYLFIPARVVKTLGGMQSGRLVCTVNGTLSFQCGLVALSKGDAYITINKARMKKLKLKVGDSVHVGLEKDESEYGMDMAEELETLLQQDEEGMRRFKLLSPGKRRYIIQYVGAVKSPQLRLDRAITLIGNLKLTTEGKENFRAILGIDK